MATKLNKRHSYGFSLTEPELRRIVNEVKEQFEKINIIPSTEIYTVEFMNGTVSEILSLTDILNLENHGQVQIVSLEIKLQDVEDKPSTSVIVKFIDIESTDSGKYDSISYSVYGNIRDWVFVTNSMLQERIEKIKTPVLLTNLASSSKAITLICAMSFYSILLFIPNSYRDIKYRHDYPEEAPIKSEVGFSKYLIAARKKGEINNGLEAVIFLEEQREKRMKDYDNKYAEWIKKADIWVEKENKKNNDKNRFKKLFNPLSKKYGPNSLFILPLVVSSLFITPLLIFRWFIKKYEPHYNFLWGDYDKLYKKKKSFKNFIYGTVLVGIAISLISGVILKLIGI